VRARGGSRRLRGQLSLQNLWHRQKYAPVRVVPQRVEFASAQYTCDSLAVTPLTRRNLNFKSDEMVVEAEAGGISQPAI
jgi:hypothetical protein